jgi:chromosome segregation ATPase
MQKIRMNLLLAAASLMLILSPLSAIAQDEPSLGDAARQARLQKQAKENSNPDAGKAPSVNDPSASNSSKKDPLTKTAQSANAAKKTSKVITSEEIPAHAGTVVGPIASSATSHAASEDQFGASASGARGEALRSQIASMKDGITSLQSQIDSVNDSIRFTSANCASGCAQWNERQLQKQQQVEQMKAQLEEQKKQLDDLQESARKQGFGSSIYDP